MRTTERARRDLYESLEHALGREEAETLMAHLPPTGFGDLATKADLLPLRNEIESMRNDIGFLSGRVDSLDTKVDALSVRVDGLDTKVSVLTRSVDALTARVDGLSDTVTMFRASTEREFDAIHKTLERIDQTLGRLDLRIDSVQQGMAIQTRWFVGGTVGAVIAVSALPQVLGLALA